MPTATPFKALGAGNGFPTITVKVDVSDYDFWTTLSGWNADSVGTPTPESIEESRAHAMSLFWNLYGINSGSCSVGNAGNTAELTFPVTLDTATITEPSGASSLLPHERAPLSADASRFDPSWKAFIEEENEYTASNILYAVLNFGINGIARLYDGDTSNEANFVGFGLNDFNTIAASAEYEPNGSTLFYAEVILTSYEDDYSDAPVVDVGYTEVNGMHFCCYAEVLDWAVESQVTTSAADRKAEASSANGQTFVEIEIESLDFYTYS